MKNEAFDKFHNHVYCWGLGDDDLACWNKDKYDDRKFVWETAFAAGQATKREENLNIERYFYES